MGIRAVTARDERSGVVDPPERAGANLEAWPTTSFTSFLVEENVEGTCADFAAAGAGGVNGGRMDTT